MSRRMSRAAAILDTAADLIENDGWTQGHFTDDSGARCASQAIYEAIPFRPDFNASDSAWVAMRNRTGHPKGPAFTWIMVWNDQPGRTQTEVVSTLRETAAFLLQESPPDD